MKHYLIESLGCAKNLVDSEVFAYILESAGYSPAPIPEEADLILINSCAFLQSALAEFDEILSGYADRKNQGEFETLIVSGCVMNRALSDFIDLFPEVDAWIGLKDFDALRSFLGASKSPAISRSPIEEGHYAYLRISDGCRNYCSYCTIPSIRGELKSIPIPELIKEAKSLASRGAKELILIAQDTCLYGTDLYGHQALPELIEAVHAIPEFHWIRLLYLHPDHFKTDWLELFKRLPKLLPYFEIPIQHSEDRILKAMNRQLGKADLFELFQRITTELPTAVLRTTLITGFPGEGPADHKRLLDFIEQVPFLHLGVFCYSQEPGTPAYDMPRQVGEKTALKRQDELLSAHRAQLEDRLGAWVGQDIEVLVEAEIEPEDDLPKGTHRYLCRAWFNAPDIDGLVFAEGKAVKPGTFVKVNIEDVIDVDLFARFI